MALKLQSTYFQTFRNVFKLLPKALRKRFIWIQILIFVTGFVDLFGLAVFIPILSAVADPQVLEGTGKLVELKAFLGIESNEIFLLYLFIGALVFFFFRTAFILFSQWIQGKFVYDIYEYIGSTTYKFYLRQRYEEFMKLDTSQIVRELTVSPQHFANFLVRSLLLVNSEFIVLLMVVVGIAVYDFRVFLLIVTTIFPVAVLFNILIKKRMNKFGTTKNKYTPILYDKSIRGAFGFIDIKLRQKEEVLIEDYLKTLKKLNKISLKTSVLKVVPAKLFELVTVSGLLMIYIYGVFIADNPGVILSLIALYAAAGYRVLPSLNKITPAFIQMQHYTYLFEVYKNPLKKAPTAFKPIENKPITFEYDIVLDHINFKFRGSDKLLFKGLETRVKKDEIVGVIGKSGSGKTTLAKLISGFIYPENGEILVDNIPLTDETRSSWMQKISYVQQSPYIEKGSLTNNIAFLEDEVDRERLMNAIQKASLSNLLDGSNPDEFLIEENGKNLSGGQKQRIIIARALYHNAELIILDEATSALDHETENEINETLKNLKGYGVTVIVIAHRYTTLKYTDRIIEMESGDIIAEKKYEQLNLN
jgi:ABC-type multidrug transport system fused ATPase/permease subunit